MPWLDRRCHDVDPNESVRTVNVPVRALSNSANDEVLLGSSGVKMSRSFEMNEIGDASRI